MYIQIYQCILYESCELLALWLCFSALGFQMIDRCYLSWEERNFEGIARDGLRVPDGAGDVFRPFLKGLPI